MIAGILLSVGPVDVIWDGLRMTYLAGMQIDGDGSGGNPEGDPDFQPDTTLHWQGRPLNAREDNWIVVPPQLILAVRGIVLGCQAYVTNARSGLREPAVVGDVGPHDKIGEGSIALAQRINLASNPLTGGTSERFIRYEIQPGVPANVNGKQYTLQPYRA